MEERNWDVIVIGGGASGMMAASAAAKNGAAVLLLEKNATLGKKLLITGGGRCNVTNAEFDTRVLLNKFKEARDYLFSTFSQWDVQDTLSFFHERDMQTKVEAEKRVFPITDKAESVWNVLVQEMIRHNVTVLSHSPVTSILHSRDIDEKKKIVGVRSGEKKYYGKAIIIATGGTSRPETGSSGDAYPWLADLGHTVITPTPSLVPLAVYDTWVKHLAGITLTDVKLHVYQNTIKQDVYRGNVTKKSLDKILFTHTGITGPSILNMSKDIGELLKYGEVIVSIDLLPHLDHEKIDKALQELFKEHDKKKLKNALSAIIPQALVGPVIDLALILHENNCNSISREERIRLTRVLKKIPIHVEKLLGLDKAIISSGGVLLDEINWKTMQSRLYPNLYIIGDMLNIDKPSGGYSLQLCWSTGHVAGIHTAQQDTSIIG